MPLTLLDLKQEASKRRSLGRIIDALKVYRLVLEGAPLDFDLRLEIADVLAGANEDRLASTVYSAVAEHDIKSGNPLRAIVAMKQLEAMGLVTDPLVVSLVSRYCVGSPGLGRSVKPAPADLSAQVRDGIDLDYPMDDREVVTEVARMAAYTGNIRNYPPLVPPMAILSTLDEGSFTKLLSLLRLKRHAHDAAIVRQGTMGDALYFVARGEVRVTKQVSRPGGEKVDLALARLGPGSLFGEMALVSSDPRGASVVCDGPVDVLELKNVDVQALARELPNVAGAMARFTRERLISNLMATNPLFQSFDEASRKQLLARFTGHEVPAGTIFIEQGAIGTGLYVILQGKAEVLSWDGEKHVKVATLGPSDVAGEISLIHEEPAMATVRTTTPATLLFLARELFYPLVEAVPDLLAHFAKLAKERLEDTELQLMKDKVLDDDFIESVEEDDELCEDDLVLV